MGRDLHKPSRCSKCSGSLQYRGVGEYVCEDCGNVMYDDFGKVRNYLEEHRGATQAETAQATGVSPNTIRHFLREERLEIAPNSQVFMHCEKCGTPIRTGRFCFACSSSSPEMKGFGKVSMGASGAKRFSR